MWLLFLVPCCVVAVLACLRLIRAAAVADTLAELSEDEMDRTAIGLYETAYLAGGPDRVVDLALVLMSGRGRLHLAHTGWTTVVDPQGRNRLERALIEEIGPEGQCRTAELREALTEHPTVAEIGRGSRWPAWPRRWRSGRAPSWRCARSARRCCSRWCCCWRR